MNVSIEVVEATRCYWREFKRAKVAGLPIRPVGRPRKANAPTKKDWVMVNGWLVSPEAAEKFAQKKKA